MTKNYWVQTYTTVITVGGMLAVRPVKPIKTHLSTGIIPLYWLLGGVKLHCWDFFLWRLCLNCGPKSKRVATSHNIDA